MWERTCFLICVSKFRSLDEDWCWCWCEWVDGNGLCLSGHLQQLPSTILISQHATFTTTMSTARAGLDASFCPRSATVSVYELRHFVVCDRSTTTAVTTTLLIFIQLAYFSQIFSITIRYDTRCYFNVRSKANMSQLNLLHGTNN